MKKQNFQKPPVIAPYLLEKILNASIKNGAVGDFIEQYYFIRNDRNRMTAWIWFWVQFLQILFSVFVNKIYWSPIMVKSYLLIAIRNLKKQKIYSLINIIGLAVGMAGFTIFALIAGVKLNADKFHKNGERTFCTVQVLSRENGDQLHTTFTSAFLKQALQNEFPEIETAARVLPAGRMTLKYKNDCFYENQILFVDPEFLSIFSFKLISGDRETALQNPNSIVMTRAMAEKYFGTENPLGKVLTLEKNIEVTVTGVAEDILRTSSIRFEFLVSMETARALAGYSETRSDKKYATFLLLPEGFDHSLLETKLPVFIQKYWPDSETAPLQMYLFPFLDIRLKSAHIQSFMASTHQATTFIAFFIGILLLLVVSINYINLSTARSMHRNREIGIRKVIGARRSQLILQFLGESLILSFIALPLAVIFYELIHHYFSNYIAPTGTFAVVSNSIFNYPFLLKYLIIAALLTGLFSGIYPAFFLSAFKPVEVLQGSLSTGRKKRRGSKILIVFQFSISIILILFASILSKQFDHYISEADFGYNRDHVAVLQISDEAREKREILKSELKKHPGVIAISAAENLPLLWSSKEPAKQPNMEDSEALSVQKFGVDYQFLNVLEIPVIKGRDFSLKKGDKNNFIINETTAKRFHWNDPIGKQLVVGNQTGTVIGVVKDFLFGDIGFEIPPAVFYLENQKLNYLLIRHSSATNLARLRDFTHQKWQAIVPDLPFDFFTLNDHFSTNDEGGESQSSGFSKE